MVGTLKKMNVVRLIALVGGATPTGFVFVGFVLSTPAPSPSQFWSPLTGGGSYFATFPVEDVHRTQNDYGVKVAQSKTI